MKSIRQKRKEDDNNKEWAQVRYSKLTTSDRSLPNFDNTQYWNGLSESSTWITNGTRGVALPDPYYNGQKVSDDYTTPIDDLLLQIGFSKAATLQMNKLMAGFGTIMTGTAAKAFYDTWKKFVGNYVFARVRIAIKQFKAGEITAQQLIRTIKGAIKSFSAVEKVSPFFALIAVEAALWFIATGFLAGNTYKDIYDAWNSFEQDSINAQHKVDTEVDEDGNPLWSGYKVVYNIDYGNTTTTQSSAMKLFKYHQLKRGRYQSKAYSKSNVVYTFKYTKSITYIPA